MLDSKASDLAISQAFLNFFYMVFGNYTKYMEDHKFNREQFKKDKPKDVQKVPNLILSSLFFSSLNTWNKLKCMKCLLESEKRCLKMEL